MQSNLNIGDKYTTSIRETAKHLLNELIPNSKEGIGETIWTHI